MSDESKKLATIVRVRELIPIAGADFVELASMEDSAWRCVCKKGDFAPGKLGVYFALDSIVDGTNPVFAFLAQHKFRIKNAKIRGVYSQGLLMPLSILYNYGYDLQTVDGLKPGDDMTTATKTTKYVKELPAQLAGKVKGAFPTQFIPKSDQENVLTYPQVLADFHGKECYLSLKADGSSGTFIMSNGEFHICSRNLELDSSDKGNVYARLAAQYDLAKKLEGMNVAIQAECVGPGIQKNPMKLTGLELRVFLVRDLNDWHYYSLSEMQDLCAKIGVPMATLIVRDTCPFVFDKNVHTVEWLQKTANEAEYAPGVAGEGIVLRTCMAEYNETLQGLLSLKCLNQNYKD